MSQTNKFCFVAIVKNEAHVIKRCIDSIANIATSYVICDTGSDDSTPEIIAEYMSEKKIPGEVIHCAWKNYSYNRSYLMDQVYTHNKAANAEYIIWHDADEVFITDPNDFTSYPTKTDADELYNWLKNTTESFTYIKTVYNGCHYQRYNIARNDQLYEWVSPKHEWMRGTVSNTSKRYEKFVLLARQEGGASKDPDRCKKDVKLFLDYIDENGGPTKCGREIFYLAQEYESFDIEKAIKYYSIKIKLDDWVQERYIAYLRLGRLIDDPELKIKYWSEGAKLVPHRLECLYDIVNYSNRITHDYALAYKYGCLAFEDHKIENDDLFIEIEKYDFLFDLDFSVSAFYDGRIQSANNINQKNMVLNKNNEGRMAKLLSNQRFIDMELANRKLIKLIPE